jgi:hypothetical protein
MTHQNGRTLWLYGHPSACEPLAFEWVEEQLRQAGTYWVVAKTDGYPHPRPVWGVWQHRNLFLSIGTPTKLAALTVDASVTVHLDSGTEVVIMEGQTAAASIDEAVLRQYGQKYDRPYDVMEYGPLTCIAPRKILAWKTAGWAGRESFRQTGCWEFD